jgi:hypothetical protein
MSKILRKAAKIFGSTSGFQEIAEFGSLAAASPLFTTDPDVIQSLSNYLEGWFSAVLGGNSPAIEDMNALCYLYAYQIAYIMQAGTAEWNAGTTYYTGSFAQVSGVIYMSRVDTNLNNPPAGDNTNWKVVGGEIMTASGDLIYGDVNGNTKRLPIGANGTALIPQSGLPVWTPVAYLVGAAYMPLTSGTFWQTSSSTLVSCGNPFLGTAPARIVTVAGPADFGVIQTTAAQHCTFTVNGLLAGTYLVRIKAWISTSAIITYVPTAAINDGTTTSLEQFFIGNTNSATLLMTLDGLFTYGSNGNQTFEVFICEASGGGTGINIDLRFSPLQFEIYRVA